MTIRKFPKLVGVRSQTEIERAVAKAIADGELKGNEAFPVWMRLTIDKIGLALTLVYYGRPPGSAGEAVKV